MNGKQRWKLGGRVPSTAASAATEACILMQTLQALRALEDLEEKDCPKIGCTPIAQKTRRISDKDGNAVELGVPHFQTNPNSPKCDWEKKKKTP